VGKADLLFRWGQLLAAVENQIAEGVPRGEEGAEFGRSVQVAYTRELEFLNFNESPTRTPATISELSP